MPALMPMVCFIKTNWWLTGKINDVGSPIRQNVANSYRAGIELDASYSLSRQFVMNANAALSRNKIKDYQDYLYEY